MASLFSGHATHKFNFCMSVVCIENIRALRYVITDLRGHAQVTIFISRMHKMLDNNFVGGNLLVSDTDLRSH